MANQKSIQSIYKVGKKKKRGRPIRTNLIENQIKFTEVREKLVEYLSNQGMSFLQFEEKYKINRSKISDFVGGKNYTNKDNRNKAKNNLSADEIATLCDVLELRYSEVFGYTDNTHDELYNHYTSGDFKNPSLDDLLKSWQPSDKSELRRIFREMTEKLMELMKKYNNNSNLKNDLQDSLKDAFVIWYMNKEKASGFEKEKYIEYRNSKQYNEDYLKKHLEKKCNKDIYDKVKTIIDLDNVMSIDEIIYCCQEINQHGNDKVSINYALNQFENPRYIHGCNDKLKKEIYRLIINDK